MCMVRYEILLPLKYNDGTPIEDVQFLQTSEEILQCFNAVSFVETRIFGRWIHDDTLYEDVLARVYVDTEETPETEQFFRDYKAILEERFQQIEIRIVAQPVRVI